MIASFQATFIDFSNDVVNIVIFINSCTTIVTYFFHFRIDYRLDIIIVYVFKHFDLNAAEA